MAAVSLQDRTSWRHWVTPKPLKDKPIHRWFVFPTSFTDDLVGALIDEWGLSFHDEILDPFVGAGTTLLAAKQRGIPAQGFDLSPLAVLATRVKITPLSTTELRRGLDALHLKIEEARLHFETPKHPELILKAFDGPVLHELDLLLSAVRSIRLSEKLRDFLILAVLKIVPLFSKAVATGGWLKWVEKEADPSSVLAAFEAQTTQMADDLNITPRSQGHRFWQVRKADSRELPVADGRFSAVITSPPYPNRHDYTRVFGVELLLGLLSWEETRSVRYQSIHSHPEARPLRFGAEAFVPPQELKKAVQDLENQGADSRVTKMLIGYFLDMYLCLKECQRIVRPGARIALVVGNVQYGGLSIPVDEWISEIGNQIGLRQEGILVTRLRGNSAQQMGKYGRNPSRESIVVFSKPA